MFALGAQEILLLLMCGGVPVIVALVVIFAIRQATRKKREVEDVDGEF